MRKYELILLFRSDVSQDLMSGFLSDIRNLVEGFGGILDKEDDWGVRNLFYPINRTRRAHIFLVYFTIAPSHISSIRESVNYNQDVIRFMIFLSDGVVISHEDSQKGSSSYSSDRFDKNDRNRSSGTSGGRSSFMQKGERGRESNESFA